MVDVEAAIIAALGELPGISAATELPGKPSVEDQAPFVLVTLLTGTEWAKSWNAGSLDRFHVDIDVFTLRDSGSAGIITTCGTVRDRLRRLDPARLVAVSTPPLVVRPEKNPRLHHRGARFEYIAR